MFGIALMGRRLMLLLTIGYGLLPNPYIADPAPSHLREMRILHSDRGGNLQNRITEIAELRAAGVSIEIRSTECLSACTIYLGLPGTCVARHTSLGFHGPSYYGAPLSKAKFEYWSQIIGTYYPPPLRRWYLRKGRFRLIGYHRLRGKELARLGVRIC